MFEISRTLVARLPTYIATTYKWRSGPAAQISVLEHPSHGEMTYSFVKQLFSHTWWEELILLSYLFMQARVSWAGGQRKLQEGRGWRPQRNKAVLSEAATQCPPLVMVSNLPVNKSVTVHDLSLKTVSQWLDIYLQNCCLLGGCICWAGINHISWSRLRSSHY